MSLAKIAQETFESEDKLADILLNFDHNMDDDKKDHKILFEPLIEILENPEFSEKESKEKSEDNEDEIKGEDSEEDDEIEVEKSEKDEEVSGHIEGEGEVTVQIGDQSPITKEYSFDLPLVPGSESQDDIVVEEEQKADDDIWSWKLENFLDWAQNMMKNWPKHNGYDISGLERAISYGEALLKEFSKAARQDIRGILDVRTLEKARNSIMDGVERLKDRLEKLQTSKSKKKKAFEVESGLIKEARAGRGAGNFVVTIPCLISGVARICINSTVSAGKDIEDTFHKMAKKLKLDEREIFQLAMVIEDMGYPLRRDRGILLNEEFDPTSSENFDYMPNYPV
jgi:hypothetical protein